ncbi:MAG TPA: TadE/TadG family type IV pilus assembly protein [Caulobacteraceae bacterium]|nr:TadE/TadG family type IV pilus assembly protein [Caulobacteraceae bacterium]
MSLFRRWLSDTKGGAAVEFSAVIMTMFTLLFGVTEFGWYMWTANALQQTAIQGARCMGVLASNCASSSAYSSTNTMSYVQNVASTYGVSVPTADVTLSTSATCSGNGDFSSVTINYTFKTVVPNVITGLSSVPLTEQACFPNQT